MEKKTKRKLSISRTKTVTPSFTALWREKYAHETPSQSESALRTQALLFLSSPSSSSTPKQHATFPCPFGGCQSVLSKKRNLTRNMKEKHNEQFVLKFSKCDYNTGRDGSLKRHMALIHDTGKAKIVPDPSTLKLQPIKDNLGNVLKFRCPVKSEDGKPCKYFSFNKWQVSRQCKTFHNKGSVEKITCHAEDCNETFVDKYSLKRHLKGRCRKGGTVESSPFLSENNSSHNKTQPDGPKFKPEEESEDDRGLPTMINTTSHCAKLEVTSTSNVYI